MSRMKKITAAILVLCLIFGCITATAADKKVTFDSPTSNYTATKVSHPDAGIGEDDGIIEYESGENDRGQSYAWSAVGYGDYVYVGTCHAAIYSTIVKMSEQSGVDLELFKKAINMAYNGTLYVGDPVNNPGDPNRSVIAKVNVKTGEAKIVEGPSTFGGYRAAIEFNGKLYFAAACSDPAPYLLEVDPKTDKTQIVYMCTKPDDPTVSVGIRGLTVVGDKLVSAAIGNDGAFIIASEDPSKGQDSFKVIATQKDLLDYPAYHYYDNIFGGSIWDMVSFNNKLYFTVVTGKKGHKQSFAMFSGEEKQDGNWNFDLLIGNPEDGAKYPYGLGDDRSGAANLVVHEDHIYIGGYNDPMVTMPKAVFRSEFEPLYHDLTSPISLWRMDKDGNIELVAGEPNELFPEVKGNMGKGFGSHFNQYIWRMQSYDGKLFVGTFDMSSVLYPFTQITNGDILKRTPEEWKSQIEYIKIFVEDFISKRIEAKTFSLTEADTLEDDAKALTKSMKKMTSLLDEGGVDDIKSSEKFYELLKKCADIYEGIREKLPEELIKTLDPFFTHEAVDNFYYFIEICKYFNTCEEGFDILVTEDGVNFDVITRNGLGDKYNHGARTFAVCDDGLFVGTANPFYGAQVWKLEEKQDASKPVVPTDKDDEMTKPEAGTTEESKTESPDTGVNTTSLAIAASALTAGIVLTLISKKKKNEI